MEKNRLIEQFNLTRKLPKLKKSVVFDPNTYGGLVKFAKATNRNVSQVVQYACETFLEKVKK